MKTRILCPQRASRMSGFTMIEVLVTLVIIALTLFGTAGLQSFAMKMNQGGQLRTQAVILALDLLERMEANNPAAVGGNAYGSGTYAVSSLPTAYTTDCYSSPCSTSALATYDLYQFRQKLLAQLPNASATITISGTGPFTYTLQISWEERIAKVASTATTTGGTTTVTNSGKTETFSYTVSRTFFDRSVVI